MRVGLSVDTLPAMRAAGFSFLKAQNTCVTVSQSPAAEHVARAASAALETAAALLAYVETFGIESERFLDYARQTNDTASLYDLVLTYVKEHQK
jgi:hypothetical protein